MNRKLVNSELDKYRKRGKGTYTYCDVGCDCNIAVNLLEENTQLKSVIKEIREYIKETCYDDNQYCHDLDFADTRVILEVIDKGIGEK